MTIDEAIETIECGYGSCENLADTPCNECIIANQCSLGIAYQTLIDFAKWYRKQDLIHRCDIIGYIIEQAKIQGNETITIDVNLIPKAEPKYVDCQWK